MTGQLTALVALAGVVLLLGLLVSLALGRRKRSTRRAVVARTPERRVHDSAPVRGAVRTGQRRPVVRLDVAEPGDRGPLFQYGGDGSGFEIDAPFAVVALATTGFSPANGDRVVEIAAARVDAAGQVSDEYSTLVNPGRDVGPVFLHGISTVEVRSAPTFGDIAGELLDRLDGAVVVLHDGAFVERFLDAEFTRIGVQLPPTPALCSQWLARRTLRTPDHTLRTLSRHAGRTVLDTSSALGAVRTVAALLPQMLAVHNRPPRYLCGLRPMPELEIAADPAPRPVELRESTDGWMTTLLARRRQPTAETVDGQRYVDTVTEALADGRLLGGEAQTLVRLGASAGLGTPSVEALHAGLLENLRAAALTDTILTTGQLRQLRTAASALGLPTYFDELRPTSPQDLIAGRSAAPAFRGPADFPERRPRVPLCTHCHRDGHNRASCPERAALSV